MASLGNFVASTLQIGAEGEAESMRQSACPPHPEVLVRKVDGSRIFPIEREIVWREYLRRITRRDEFALQSLFEETRAMVFATAMRFIRFQIDAEEVTGDVYARVWKIAATYDSYRGQVAAWLASMARSIAIDRLRANAVRRRSEEAFVSHFRKGDDTEALVSESQTRTFVLRAMSGLPADQRQAIELFYFSDLLLKDVAKRLGQPVGTIKSRVRLGIVKLRRVLAALEKTPVSRMAITPHGRAQTRLHSEMLKRGA